MKGIPTCHVSNTRQTDTGVDCEGVRLVGDRDNGEAMVFSPLVILGGMEDTTRERGLFRRNKHMTTGGLRVGRVQRFVLERVRSGPIRSCGIMGTCGHAPTTNNGWTPERFSTGKAMLEQNRDFACKKGLFDGIKKAIIVVKWG